VDISPFLNNLPFGSSTTNFSSDDASGSTSQAAAIVEAVEAGCGLLLMDEDTCATNFMIRDARMQALVSAAQEPITPFLRRVRSLFDDAGVSTVLVCGGSGDYFDVADTVNTEPWRSSHREKGYFFDLTTFFPIFFCRCKSFVATTDL